jgi:hypothetical protein
MKPLRKRLLFVSVGLSPHGGGIATAGGCCCARCATSPSERDVELRLLTLARTMTRCRTASTGRPSTATAAPSRAPFGRRSSARASATSLRLLGVARIQGILPRAFCARYLLYVYGIEVGARSPARGRALDSPPPCGWPVRRTPSSGCGGHNPRRRGDAAPPGIQDAMSADGDGGQPVDTDCSRGW